jgi:hypothetical protein
MKLKSFDQFVFENLQSGLDAPGNFGMSISKKLNCFSTQYWFAFDDTTGVDEIHGIAKRDLFNMIEKDNFLSGMTSIDTSLPALGYVTTFTRLMIDQGYNPEIIYNLPEESLKLRKVNLYSQLNIMGCPHISKTVFKIEEVQTLQFPIIAKVEDSWQSKGVQKFDTVEELITSGIEFDLYQEAFDIDKEWRVIVFKGKKDTTPKILSISLRTPINEKSKSLRVSESVEDIAKNESSKFKWTGIDFYNGCENTPDLQQVAAIINHVLEVSPGMNVFAVDVALDKSGKYWLIEANVQPGQNGNTSHLMYLNLLKDFYGLTISGDDVDKMRTSMYNAVEWTRRHLFGYTIPNCLIMEPKYWYGSPTR